MQYSDVPELETYLHIASKQDGSEAEPACLFFMQSW
jgi:hypothetical protein